MQRNPQTEVRVGLFVMAALVIGSLLAFLIGQQQNLFRSKMLYHVRFKNVDGLRKGSPVRIAGVDVGEVSRVAFRDSGDVEIDLSIVESAHTLIKKGSLASVDNKGLLGDKLVNITPGHGEVLPENSWLNAAPVSGLTAAMQQAEATIRDIRHAVKPLGEPEFANHVRDITRNLSRISDMVANGNGALQALLTDPKTATSMKETLDHIRTTSDELAKFLGSARKVTEEIEKGDGTAHQIIYGDGGARLVSNLADATGELATLLRAVRTENGTAHDLIYENRTRDLIDNLTATSRDLRQIAANINAGRGTLGALISDPSIYEDVKRLVGDLQRNEILRALVRYAIRRDETKQAPRVEPRPSPPQ